MLDRPNPPLDEQRLAREVLSRIGGRRAPVWRVLTGRWVVLTATAAAVALYIWSVLGAAAPQAAGVPDDRLLRCLTAAAAGMTFAVSYVQWSLARHGISFDKFYDRLKLANEYITQAGLGRTRSGDSPVLDHLRNMVAFAELDNLEYILGKRRLNYVAFDLVDRAVRSFSKQCGQPWFREKVRSWVGAEERQQVAAGYDLHTRGAARFIVARYATERTAADRRP